ncbi:MAG TPA: serine protease [Casimicrobiaceae bacterium]|nr:serine protease [Casimicrobiaceae bacterium]
MERERAAIDAMIRKFCTALVPALVSLVAPEAALADGAVATIERVKTSIVAIGTYERTRSPGFQFRATGFAVGDGTLVATNAHGLPLSLDSEHRETLAIMIPGRGREPQMREARTVVVDPDSDLALLRIEGAPLPPLKLGPDGAREGQSVLFTGFPIGAVLGIIPATHRGMISALTPIAIPTPAAANLDARIVRRLTTGPFIVLQLDATAYPGNSGSPLYDPDTGEVLGIINMVLVKSTRESTISEPSGITYAIPARHLKNLLDRVHG